MAGYVSRTYSSALSPTVQILANHLKTDASVIKGFLNRPQLGRLDDCKYNFHVGPFLPPGFLQAVSMLWHRGWPAGKEVSPVKLGTSTIIP